MQRMHEQTKSPGTSPAGAAQTTNVTQLIPAAKQRDHCSTRAVEWFCIVDEAQTDKIDARMKDITTTNTNAKMWESPPTSEEEKGF